MNTLLDELEDALKWRFDIVADRALYERDPDEHTARLQKASETVARITRDLPPDTDTRLRHYLDKQSYIKAYDWLKTRRR